MLKSCCRMQLLTSGASLEAGYQVLKVKLGKIQKKETSLKLVDEVKFQVIEPLHVYEDVIRLTFNVHLFLFPEEVMNSSLHQEMTNLSGLLHFHELSLRSRKN